MKLDIEDIHCNEEESPQQRLTVDIDSPQVGKQVNIQSPDDTLDAISTDRKFSVIKPQRTEDLEEENNHYLDKINARRVCGIHKFKIRFCISILFAIYTVRYCTNFDFLN